MRMWNVKPSIMCRKHLLGEHVELHMIVGSMQKGKNLDGFINKGLLETHNIIKRHNILVREMIKRGYSHKSPLTHTDLLTKNNIYMSSNTIMKKGKINSSENYKELSRRCKECKKRMEAKK